MEQQIHHIGRIRYRKVPARVIILLRLWPQRTAGHRDKHIDATSQSPLEMQRHAGATANTMRVNRESHGPRQPFTNSRTKQAQRTGIPLTEGDFALRRQGKQRRFTAPQVM
ncbi:cysteine proteinase [Lasius niger]|uniref:Cysteine proteinase n=1 Tax=Lasius niger TaxID=67767 RepID=A0A0J7K8S0_LASNI|nr:cysteine proteinase [Lasius niger]